MLCEWKVSQNRIGGVMNILVGANAMELVCLFIMLFFRRDIKPISVDGMGTG